MQFDGDPGRGLGFVRQTNFVLRWNVSDGAEQWQWLTASPSIGFCGNNSMKASSLVCSRKECSGDVFSGRHDTMTNASKCPELCLAYQACSFATYWGPPYNYCYLFSSSKCSNPVRDGATTSWRRSTCTVGAEERSVYITREENLAGQFQIDLRLDASQLPARGRPYQSTLNLEWHNDNIGPMHASGRERITVQLFVTQSGCTNRTCEQCTPGHHNPPSCAPCPFGQYGLSDKCHACPRGANCPSGLSIRARPGWWQGLPFHKTLIDESTAAVLQSSGAWAELEITDAVARNDLKQWLISSPFSVINKNDGKAGIYKCPGGTSACPNSEAHTCAEGHKGIACALCQQGWAQDARRQCVECQSGSASYLAPFVAVCSAIVPFLVWLVLAQPLRASGGPSRPAQWIMKLSFVQKVRQTVAPHLASLATKYLKLTVNSDPYASKAFAKPTASLQSAKILISFAQVMGALASDNHRSLLHWTFV